MNPIPSLSFARAAVAAILLTGLSVSLTAQADDDHHRRTEAAIPVEGIVQILTFDGYQHIHSIDLEHGAYRVRALDANGQAARLSVDPDTGAYQPAERKTSRDERPAERQTTQLASLATTLGGTTPGNPDAGAVWSSGRF